MSPKAARILSAAYGKEDRDLYIFNVGAWIGSDLARHRQNCGLIPNAPLRFDGFT
jgi:hypothetical protein